MGGAEVREDWTPRNGVFEQEVCGGHWSWAKSEKENIGV